ncbi:MAG TPA: hypothetical protein VE650_06005, partial [Acetobacteraceae bacterium]|nr:hypothetical protein [Acetobacteraceae bacterium]
MLRVFLTWWVRQLAGLLPVRWRRGPSDAAARDAVIITLPAGAPATVDLTLRRDQRDSQLGRFALNDAGLQALRAAVGAARRGPVLLALPPRLLLEQDVTLPLAAGRELDSVLRYEMDRLTPFAADAVHWSCAIEQRDRQRSWLRLRLRLVPKAAVASVLEALGAVGLVPAALVASGAASRAIPLTRRRAGPWRQRGLALAGISFAVLAVAASAVPFVQQSVQAGR